MLVKSGVNLNAKNSENKTALDIAANEDIARILLSVGARHGEEVVDAPLLANQLRSDTTIMNKVTIYVSRFRSEILEEQRSTWLIVATLVATATYQTVLNPPGGFYQTNATNKNLNTTSSDSTISSDQGNAGKSVLSNLNFILYSHLNVFSFLISVMAILIMTPWGAVGGTLVFGPVVWFALSYMYAMTVISPAPFSPLIHILISSLIGLSIFYVLILNIIKLYRNRQLQLIVDQHGH